MKIIIKRAHKKDWLKLAKLHHDFRRFHFKIIDKISRKFRIFEAPYLQVTFKRILRDKKKLYLVAICGKEIIGFAIAEIAHKKYQEVKVVEGTIARLYVTKKFRGKGVSTLLLKRIQHWFNAKKVKYVDICVLAKNIKAMDVYKKWGFKPFVVVMQKAF